MANNKYILLSLLAILLLTTIASATEKSDWVTLVENTPSCFNCHTTYKICNPIGTLTTAQQDFNILYRQDPFNYVENTNLVDVTIDDNIKYATWENVEETVPTYGWIISKVTCLSPNIFSSGSINEVDWASCETTNGTSIWYYDYVTNIKVDKGEADAHVYQQIGTTKIIVPQWVWQNKPFKETKEFIKILGQEECILITISGNLKPFSKVDNVIQWGDYTFNEYAWWSSTYTYRRAITDFSSVVMPINASKIWSASDIDSNGTDEWIYSYPCGTTNNSIYYNDSSTYAVVGDDTTECFSFQTSPTVIYNTTDGDGYLEFYMPLDNSGTEAIDFSGNELNGTLVNTPTQNVAGKINKAYDFEKDTAEYISMGTNNWEYSTHSVSVWVKPESYITGFNSIVSERDVGARYGWGVNLYQQSAECAIGTSASGSGGGDAYEPVGSGTILNDEWHHIVCVFDGTTSLRLYVDGALSVTDASISARTYAVDTYSSIGRAGTTSNQAYFDGVIDDVRIYDRVLTPTEIKDLYDMNSTLGSQETDSACIPLLTNTSWGNWTNTTGLCLFNDTISQVRNLTEYDANECGGANTTYYDYQYIECDSLFSLNYYCPKVACVNETFSIWVDYLYSGIDITNATVNLTDGITLYNLPYNTSYEQYRQDFISITDLNWTYTLYIDGVDGANRSCWTDVQECYDVTVDIWEEVEYKIYANTSNYAVKVKNYDKELNDPYINNFAYIFAMYNDIEITDLNAESCGFKTGAEQSAWDLINIGNWMGDQWGDMVKGDLGYFAGCDKFWFNAEYEDGQAILNLPYTGNYSLWLIDGSMTWFSQYSPPDIIKSNLFISLGNVNIEDKEDITLTYWLDHEEIDTWGAFTDSIYVWMLLLGIFIFIGLNMVGLGLKPSLGITLLWVVIWTILRML